MQQIDGLKFTAPDEVPFDAYPHFVRTISSDDNMAQTTKELYYWMGRTGIDSISKILELTSLPPSNVTNILDMPSGWGMVLRHMKYSWPKARITACDIVESAISFCSETFGATPVLSFENLDEVVFDNAFDIIWCGSLFTHLDAQSSNALVRLLHRHINKNGVIIFSLAGEFVYNLTVQGELRGLPESTIPKIVSDFQNTGFAHAKYAPGLLDYAAQYGRTFIGKAWLDKTWGAFDDLQEIAYINRGYARRQDVVGYQKI